MKRWGERLRDSDWERQRPAGRRRVAPPKPPKPAGRMPALPVAAASFDEPPRMAGNLAPAWSETIP